MKGNVIVSFWASTILFLCAGCVANSDVDAIRALVPASQTPSAVITEMFEQIERILDSNDDPVHSVSRKSCRKLLARAKARYGDTKGGAALFEKQFEELANLEPDEKEIAFGILLLEMGEASLAPDAARKAEAHASPTVRAIAPIILGQLQFLDSQDEDARNSFKRALTMLKNAPESLLKTNLVFQIITDVEMSDSMPDVILFAEECIPKKQEDFQSLPRFMFSQTWCKVHKDDLAAGKFEPFLKRAEAEIDDRAQADYVRAVIREQMRRDNFADVPKTIDRIFPPGADKKQVAADAAAIFGRFDGRDLCLETWAIGCTQYGKLADAMTVADSIEELSRRTAAINKMIGVLIGKDVQAMIFYEIFPDTLLGGDTPDKDISAPKYSEAELLKFCRWYAATEEQMPYTNAKIQRTASAAGLMRRFGFKKEADELFDKAFADVLATKESNRIYAVEPIITHRISAGEVDAALDFIGKLPENGIEVRAHQKVTWLCAMEKFDEAVAVAGEERQSHYLLADIGDSLLTLGRKEDAKKIFEKALASEDEYHDTMVGGLLIRAGMIDEAFRYVERFPTAQDRAALLTYIAQQQRADGNTTEADKTLLEAVKQVEQIEPQYDGNRHMQLEAVLIQLVMDPRIIKRSSEQLGRNNMEVRRKKPAKTAKFTAATSVLQENPTPYALTPF